MWSAWPSLILATGMPILISRSIVTGYGFAAKGFAPVWEMGLDVRWQTSGFRSEGPPPARNR